MIDESQDRESPLDRELLRQLELATARHAPPARHARQESPAPQESSLDPETALLRDSWNSFAQLLDNVDASLAAPVIRVELQSRSSRLVGVATFVTALALLWAIVGWVLWMRPAQDVAVQSAPSVAAANSAAISHSPDAETIMPAWTDALDEDLESMHSQILDMSSQSHTDRRLRSLSWQFEQMREELADDSL